MVDDNLMRKATSVAKELVDHSPSPASQPPLTGVNTKTGGLQSWGRGLTNIPGYEENYSITEDGKVWHNKRKHWIAQNDLGRGWLKVELWQNGKRKNFKVHRLVALTFIPNPENKRCINHIDGDKLNNHVNNLEWCTHQENMNHAKAHGLMWWQKGKKVISYERFS